MRHSRFGLLRVFALVAMVFSMSGVFSLTASAAPGSAGSLSHVQAQDSNLCTTLYIDGVVEADGSYIWQDGWGWTPIGQANSLREAYGLQWGVGTEIVSNEGCVGLVEVPAPDPVPLDAYLYVSPAGVSGSFNGSCDGTPVTGTFDGGDHGQYIGLFVEGTECTLDLFADGYNQGSAVGSLVLGSDGTYVYMSGSLGDPIEEPEPEYVQTYVHVTPQGVAGTVYGTCGVVDVSGSTFGTDGWGDLGLFEVGVECDLTLVADGYEDGVAVGVTYGVHDYAMIDGVLGDPLPDPEPELVRTLVHVTPDGVAGTVSGTCDGVDVDGTFGTDGWGDLGDFEVGVECDLTLSADGYEDGSAAGFTFANADYAMIEGALGDPIEEPEPEYVRTLVHVTPQGVAGTVYGTCGVVDVSGSTFGTDGWGDLGLFEVGVECDLTLVADGYEDGSAVGATVANFDYAMIEGTLGDPIEEPEPQPETYPVMITGNTDDGGSAEGALVYIHNTDDDGVQAFFQPAPDADGTLNADNSFSIELEAGEYVVTIDAIDQGYSYNFAAFSVPTDDPVTVELSSAFVPDSGFVHIHHYACEGTDEVVFSDNLDGVHEGCTPAAGTFTFYLVGDGTDDYVQVKVGKDGVEGADLVAGTYEVVHEETQAKAEVVIEAGDVTELVVLSPATSGDPDTGGDKSGEEGQKDKGKKGKKKSAVSELPKTGSGQQTSTTHMAAMLVAAAAVSAAAGGVALRQKRS